MAVKDIVKGHCGDSKCTYDVYTKEKVDELLNKYEVLTGTITSGMNNIAYPEGYTKDNCIVISLAMQYDSGPWEYQYAHNDIEISCLVKLTDSNIYLQDNNMGATTRNYKIVLMKIA